MIRNTEYTIKILVPIKKGCRKYGLGMFDDLEPKIFSDQKKVIDRESKLIRRKIKETIHYLKNPNHINKISYMLPEIWLPNLR